MTKKLIAGYAEMGPSDGMGPFFRIFDEGERLWTRDNLKGIDAIILWGGSDISPSLYGEKPHYNSGPPQPSERDLFEWGVLSEATSLEIPIIGVCRGAQMLCAFAGGKLIQDVTGHGQNHDVTTHDGKVFHNVTSSHHQMMYPYEVDHDLLAWSSKHLGKWYSPMGKDYTQALEKREKLEAEVVYFPTINGFAIQSHPEWERHSTYTTWLMEQIAEFCF